eukprot:TRINITY_DN6037_c1_g1_i1.p1 TRINITY_DN6037_c1_g1~~TRINITY_DN6037_c1_g1_i1.p1  ORF type:complete len:105 (+),score=12.56 TRINITY_DN6037_c1_g1_i1:110-424(+)
MENKKTEAVEVEVAFPHKYNIDIPFPKEEWAQNVCRTLSADRELKEDQVHRVMIVEGTHLKVTFETTELRLLRTVVTSFFDMLLLCMNAINIFSDLKQYPIHPS